MYYSEETISEIRIFLGKICDICKSQFPGSLSVGYWPGDHEAPSVDPARFYIKEQKKKWFFFDSSRWLMTISIVGLGDEIFCTLLENTISDVARRIVQEYADTHGYMVTFN